MHTFEIPSGVGADGAATLREFRAHQIPARTQHHLVRRLAPFAEALLALKDTKRLGNDPSVFVQPFARALAEMKEEDSDYIFDACLAVVEIKQHDRWMRIAVAGTDRLLHEDIDLLQQYLIIGHVLQGSLGPFIDAVKRTFAKTFAAMAAARTTTQP